MTYGVRSLSYVGRNPASWQVFEASEHLPEEIVAECGNERRAQHICALLNGSTVSNSTALGGHPAGVITDSAGGITTEHKLATLRGNFARMMADRDAT